MTARDERKKSDRNRGPKHTWPKATRPKEPGPPHMVTDHAMIRYFERVVGLDVAALRDTLLTAEQQALAKRMVNVDIPIAAGLMAVVRGGRVVTLHDSR